MDLYYGTLYWSTTGASPLRLTQREPASRYDAIVVGGGMSGALTAYTLAAEGLKVAVLDKGSMACGSSLANTGLIQYSNDIMLHQLMQQIGETNAVQFYRMCVKAIDRLERVARSVYEPTDFARRASLYFASVEPDVELLQKEYQALHENGFHVNYLTADEIARRYPFRKPAALLTYGDAELNPYRFVRAILTYLEQKGVHFFEDTEVTSLEDKPDGITVHTPKGLFSADHVIVTTGYSPPPGLEESGVDLNRSYAVATRPLENLDSAWKDRELIWETRRPYFYLRTTTDGRIVAGGLDEDTSEVPHSKELIARRAEALKLELESLFPMLEIQIEYAWAAVFGESRDNLPFIGQHPERERLYYLLGYGGNGTVYSTLGSEIIRDLILGKNNPNAGLVKLARPGRTATNTAGSR
jgi:glycine/D-amino acid oxidase-like deaminating enzyme